MSDNTDPVQELAVDRALAQRSKQYQWIDGANKIMYKMALHVDPYSTAQRHVPATYRQH